MKRIRLALSRFVDYIFQNVPRNYAEFPLKGFVFTGESYMVDGIHYEELAHEDQPGLRIILDVNANKIIRIVAGNRALLL